MKDVTLFELDVFAELGKKRSLRSVARSKGLTPSHVSKVLSRLEKKLKANLVKRSAVGIILSPEGQSLVSHAEKILHQAKGLESGSGHAHGEAQHLMGIGGTNFLLNELLVPNLRCLTEKHGVRFRLLNLIPDQVVSSGLLGAFEISLHLGELDWPASWMSEEIGKTEFALLARKDHPLEPVSKQSVVQTFPFVVPNYWGSQGFFVGNDFCPLDWKDRILGHEVSQAERAIRVACATDQLVFCPLVLAANALKTGELRRIEIPEWKKRVFKPIILSIQDQVVSERLYKTLKSLLKKQLKVIMDF